MAEFDHQMVRLIINVDQRNPFTHLKLLTKAVVGNFGEWLTGNDPDGETVRFYMLS